MSTEDLYQQAMQLPPDDREVLAVRLFISLKSQTDLSVEEAWDEEILARIEDLESGKETTVSSEEVFRKIAEQYGEKAK